MKVCFVIGHPAHVHYFKNLIKALKEEQIEVLVLARRKEFTFQLLEGLKIKYTDIGRGSDSKIGKFVNLFVFVCRIFIITNKEKPSIFVSFANPYASIVSWLQRKRSITLDDTEHNSLNHFIYKLFTTKILTSNRFRKNFGLKQIRRDFSTEMMYLAGNYFVPDESVLKNLIQSSNQQFILVRFVSWKALHDNAINELNIESKISFIRNLSKLARVLISSEEVLPEEIMQYGIRIKPERIHDALYFCSAFVGDSGTMSTEAAFLGTPSICLNPDAKKFGVFDYYTEAGLLLLETDLGKVESIIKNILKQDERGMYRQKANELQARFVDINTEIIQMIQINLKKNVQV